MNPDLNWRKKLWKWLLVWVRRWGKKRILSFKRFFDENNIDVNSTHTLDAIVTRLKREGFFEVIDALRLQINERFHADNLNIAKEMPTFCHENLLKKLYSIRVDNLCEHCNLDPDIVKVHLHSSRQHTVSNIFRIWCPRQMSWTECS